jgi:hypothetical protein
MIALVLEVQVPAMTVPFGALPDDLRLLTWS